MNLLKVLQWLTKLFQQLKENNYNMAAFEFHALVPHLIGKLGESRQEVRDSIHELLRFVFAEFIAMK